jgi:transcriptional regulator with XRE-family HTH domain
MSEQNLELAALGQTIRQLRQQRGMTRAELAAAAAAGVDEPYLEALEAGRPVVLDAQSPQAASVVFGRRLRELRAEHGLSQDQLAERTGMHPTAIGRLERGVRDHGSRRSSASLTAWVFSLGRCSTGQTTLRRRRLSPKRQPAQPWQLARYRPKEARRAPEAVALASAQER